MARSSILEDIVKVTSELPWWLSVSIGGGFFYFFKFYMPSQMSEALRPTWSPLYSILGYIVLGACLVGAAIGGIRRLREYWIYRKQTSLDTIRSLSWTDFERMVTEAFRRQGYAAQRTPPGPDGGIDIVLNKAGQTTLVQCKQWRRSRVGVKPVRELAGVIAALKADSGIFVCSGAYTREAIEFAGAANIDLVDGTRLAKMMDMDMARTPTLAPVHSESSPNCPRCNSRLVRRVARKGEHAGSEFYGCSAFPKCRYTRSVVGWNERREARSRAVRRHQEFSTCCRCVNFARNSRAS